MTDSHSDPRRAVLSLGSNLGERENFLVGAVQALSKMPGISPVAVSSVYETAPLGGVEQPPYLNAVLLVDTVLTPVELMDAALVVEAAHGRIRAERWGPRTLDIDIIALGDETSDDPAVTLPHPRAHERAFVLVPWAELDPDASLPRWGSVLELLGTLSPADRGSVRLYTGLHLTVEPERGP